MSTLLLQAARPVTAERLHSFLDEVCAELRGGASTRDAIERLRLGLWECRSVSQGQWADCCRLALRHPITSLIHQDPFTQRSFMKPRGYAGDAGLIDLIYYDQGHGTVNTTAIGEAIYRASRDTPAPRAVRERRDHMAALIDRVALRVADASVLVLAAGHLREGLKSSAVMAGALGSLVALDQDAESLEVVREAFGPRVTCVHSSIRRLVTKSVPSVTKCRYDLIYAAGLLDYLSDRMAARLLEVCSGLLKPGGELVVANFTPDITDAGYMESYMSWHLIYRDRAAMLRLAMSLPSHGRHQARCYALGCQDIVYLSLSAT